MKVNASSPLVAGCDDILAPQSCPVCGSSDTSAFVHRSFVPVHQDLVLASAAEARSFGRGQLTMYACGDCGFAFNAAFDLSLMSYGACYDNTQTCSPGFDQYLNNLVRYLVEERDVRNCTVVEVGCGKGEFIRRLVRYPGANVTGHGFDPTYVGPDVEYGGRLRFEKRFYDEHASSLPADVVICRHVIEHVPEPLQLLNGVRRAVERRPNALVCFETPCLEWILRDAVFWDLFYEHCSLFTSASLTTAFELSGLEVLGVRYVFGGQYLWLEGRPASGPRRAHKNRGDVIKLARRFSALEGRLRAQWRAPISRALGAPESDGADGRRIAVWGAGAKGVTFVNLVDPDSRQIHCLVDVNPNKQQKYVPGTGHPIIAPAMIGDEGIEAVIVLNPNYVKEISAALRQQGSQVAVIDLMAELA